METDGQNGLWTSLLKADAKMTQENVNILSFDWWWWFLEIGIMIKENLNDKI